MTACHVPGASHPDTRPCWCWAGAAVATPAGLLTKELVDTRSRLPWRG